MGKPAPKGGKNNKSPDGKVSAAAESRPSPDGKVSTTVDSFPTPDRTKMQAENVQFSTFSFQFSIE